MRWMLVPLAIVVFALSACSKLPGKNDMLPAELTSLDDIPAAYGELVAVTFAPQPNDAVGWRELWFQNEETGKITYVPALLPAWKYYPKMVRTFDRP